jgi:hypothetical protein
MVAGSIHLHLQPACKSALLEPGSGSQVGFAEGWAMNAPVAGAADASQAIEILFETLGIYGQCFHRELLGRNGLMNLECELSPHYKALEVFCKRASLENFTTNGSLELDKKGNINLIMSYNIPYLNL